MLEKMRLFLAAAAVAALVMVGGSTLSEYAMAAKGGGKWDGDLSGSHSDISRSGIEKMLRDEGINNPAPLLNSPYLVRIEITNTGGGSASHSEVMLQFAGKPDAAIGRAWADQNEPHRAQIGNYDDCLKGGSYPPEGHSCSTNYNARGWVMLTQAVNRSNKVLIINDPNIGNRAGTVIWFGFHNPQKNIHYDIIEKTTGYTFGFGTISARKYAVSGAVIPPPVTPPPVGVNWNGNLSGPHTNISMQEITNLLRSEGIANPGLLTGSKYLVRVEISDTGGGSASHSEVMLQFSAKPDAAVGKAWADQNEPARAQIGNYENCKSGGSYPPEGHSCATRYNAQGWVILTQAVNRSNRVLIINDPNAGNRAGTVVWLGFSSPQHSIPYDIIEKTTGHTFGFGKISARKYEISGGHTPPPVTPPHRPPHRPPPPPSPPPPPGEKWDGTFREAHTDVTRDALFKMMSDDGIDTTHFYAYKFPYYVRIEIDNAGGGKATHSEVLFEFDSTPKRVLARGWSDNDSPNAVMIGNFGTKCDSDESLPPYGHTCRKKINNRGWKDVTDALDNGKKVLVVADSNAPREARVVVWIGFDEEQKSINYDIIENVTGKSFGRPSVSVRKYRQTVTRKPR